MDPLTLSINTARGEAMHAVVQYAAWRKPEDNPEAFGLKDLPAVRKNLEAHLDPSQDPSETVRAVFGSRLSQLFWIDSVWVGNQISRIFPKDDDRLRLAAWETYLVWGRPSKPLYRLLSDLYARSVEELPTPKERRERAGKEPGLALAEHISAFFWWGVLDLSEGGLLHRFVEKASPDEVAHLVSYIGRSLADAEIDEDVASRLMALWDQLQQWVKDRPEGERFVILAPFGWWYGSAALDADWSDRQLIALLKKRVPIDPDFKVAERVKARAGEDIHSATRVVEAYLPALGGGWQIYGVRDEVRFVLSKALRSGDRELADAAKQAVHDLGAKGLMDFRDLLSQQNTKSNAEDD